MTSRISGWFVLSAVFIVAVFGLFFTFTERKTWPEHRIELSANDQRLIPPASTVWCEAVALYSDHPFVAYQVSQSPLVNPNHLKKQTVSVNLKLGRTRSRNSFKLKYFLLTSSILEVFACASEPGARLLVFKGEEGVHPYLEELTKMENSDSDESDDSSEEMKVSKIDCSNAKNEIFTLCRNIKKRPSLVSDTVVGVGDEVACDASEQRPVIVNITHDGFYVIAALNTNTRNVNHMRLQLVIDRSRYTVIKSGQSSDICSLSTTCTIGLSFASDDSALVWIPDEPNAGRISFTIRSRCKPRLAVFAILSVFLPLVFFVLVAFFVRADRDRIRRIYTRQIRSQMSEEVRINRRIAAPLLRDDIPVSEQPHHCPSVGEEPETDSAFAQEELPPAYHTLYDLPPPYTCVKLDGEK